MFHTIEMLRTAYDNNILKIAPPDFQKSYFNLHPTEFVMGFIKHTCNFVTLDQFFDKFNFDERYAILK